VPILIGTGGAVAGYTLSNDSAIGDVKTDYRILWDACMDKIQGEETEILETNESKGIIKARVSGNNITIRIDTINDKTQKLKVSARKHLLPKPQFAQKIFLRIIESLQ
jgi:hypothetical protein